MADGSNDVRRHLGAEPRAQLRELRDPDDLGHAEMQTVHDRMPVILRPEHYERWLDPSEPADDLLAPLPAGALRLFRVDPKVNTYKVDEPSCIEPLLA